MTSLPPDHDPVASPSMSLGSGEIPAELEGIQRDLLADAAEWERGVPQAARFNQRLRAALQIDESAEVTNQASRVTRFHAPREATSTPRSRPHTYMRPTPLSTALALVATVAVVALLAAVVATLRPRGAATQTTTTRTGTPTPILPAPGPIKTLPLRATYAQQPGIPVVAASNPNVIYEYSDATGTPFLQPGTPVLRRSDDGGASWQALAYPSAPGTFVSNLTLAVNPADAANVFLQVALGYHPGQAGACRQANPNAKSIVCIGEYASSDYGAHWSLMRYPVPGTLFPNVITFNYDARLVQAQGDRVYAALQDYNEVRILSSTDHGATWHVADAALAVAGLHICDFEAAPVGATLFARTAAVCQGQDVTSLQLWRSDDAGVHWRHVTPFAAPFSSIWNTFTVASATGSGSNQVILYEGVLDQQTGAVTYYASLDGGVSWQPAPAAGLPQGAQAVQLAIQLSPGQTLRDASLVVAFETGGGASNGGPQPAGAGPTPTPSPMQDAQESGATITCYAWKAGSARWVPLTQPVATGGLSLANLYVADSVQRAVVLSLGDSMMPGAAHTIDLFE